jgi:hypothetical protein
VSIVFARRDIYIMNGWYFSSPLLEGTSSMVNPPVDLFPLYLGTPIPKLTKFLFKMWIHIFRRVCKFSERCCYLRHVCPSVRMKQLGCQWMNVYQL